MRGQSAIEFLTTYSWAFLLLGIFVSAIALISLSSNAGISTLVPSSCYIAPSLPCSQAAVSGNALGSTFVLILQNNLGVKLSFPANAIQVKPSMYTSNTYLGTCLPQTVSSGSTFICSVKLSNFNPAVGSQLNPSFILKYKLCSPTCTAQVYNTSGTALTSMMPYKNILSNVTLLSNPSSGTVALGGARYASGANVFVLTGTGYPISALAPAGYGFSSWIATANLVVGNTLSSSTTLTASGQGSLTANFITLTTSIYTTSTTSTSTTSTSSTSTTSTIYPVVVLSPASNSIADVGQYEAFTATVSNGAPTFTYNYAIVNSITLGKVVHSASYTGVASTSNTYVFQIVSADTSNDPEMANIIVTDATPNTYNSVYSGTFVANPALATPTLSPIDPTIDVGQTEIYTASWSGGSSPYTVNYVYTNNAVIAQSYTGVASTSNTYTFAPPSANTYTYNVIVTDGASTQVTANSITNTIIVSLMPGTPTLSPSAALLYIGQTETYTASWSGGSSPYTVNYVYTNNAVIAQSYTGVASTSNTYTFSPSVAGTYTYNVMVSDAGTPVVTKGSVTNTIVVNAALATPTLSPNDPSIDAGQTEIYTASWSGGLSPYTVNYVYTNNGLVAKSYTGVASTSNTYTFSPAVAGTYTYNVIISDAGTAIAGSVTNTLVVAAALATPTLSPSNTLMDAGQTEVYTASWSGGSSPYTVNYIYTNNGIVAQSYTGVASTSNSYTFAPSTAATYTYNVIVLDAGSPVVARGSTTNTIVLNSALAAGAITPSSPSVFRGGSVTLTANPSGGTAGYTYAWYSGTCSGSSLGSSSTYAAAPTTSTTYYYKVSDSATTPNSMCSAGDTVSMAIMLKQQASNSIAAVNSLAFTPQTVGDKLVVVVSYTPTSAITLPTVYDTQGASWTQRTSKNTGGSSKYAYSEIYDANVVSASADTVKVSAATLNGMMAIYELTPVGSAQGIKIATATSGSSGTTFNTISLTFTAPAILISGVANFGGSPTAGTGYTMMKSGGSGSEYSANSIATPSNFLATGSSNYWVDIGVAYQAN